jgi:hypothetical protein
VIIGGKARAKPIPELLGILQPPYLAYKSTYTVEHKLRILTAVSTKMDLTRYVLLIRRLSRSIINDP